MKNWPVIGVIFGVGWYIAGSLLIPFGIGLWLDKHKFNTFPVLTFVGLGLGTIIMAFGVYRMIQQIRRDEKNLGSRTPHRSLVSRTQGESKNNKKQ